MKPPLKTPLQWTLEIFQVGEHIKGLGREHGGPVPLPLYLDLCSSSIWLFLNFILYNKAAVVSMTFSVNSISSVNKFSNVLKSYNTLKFVVK